jgi:hypothetical protein
MNSEQSEKFKGMDDQELLRAVTAEAGSYTSESQIALRQELYARGYSDSDIASAASEAIPETTHCPYCENEIHLDKAEREKAEYVCPWCAKTVKMVTGDAQVASQVELDPPKVQRFQQQLKDEQNLSLGIVAGLGAALAGSIVWALVTDAFNIQIGFMAIGVGFLVGIAVRHFGKGIEATFGVLGAILSLVGCLFGNLLTVCLAVAELEQIPVSEVVSLLNAEVIVELMSATFYPMDVLFYGIAIYAGYKYSFRRITEEELAELVK